MDYTTSQLYNDVDIRLNEPVDTDEGFVQEEVLSIVIPQSLPSFTPPPQQSSPTPPPTTEATNPQSTLPNFASAVLAKESSQPQSSYKVAATLIEFKLKKILIDKMDKMYSLKRSRKDKDKDEDPSTGSGQGLNKRKTSKDAEPVNGPKAKESQSSSSKGNKSKSKSSRNSVQSEEPDIEVADSDMPHDQEENLDNVDEPKENVAIKRDCGSDSPQKPVSTPSVHKDVGITRSALHVVKSS
nr:hypothetical protein [Tanacetum cinerariifolium]